MISGKHLGVALIILGSSSGECLASDLWTCTYPDFSAARKPTTVTFSVNGDKLVDEEWGTPIYDIVENNEYGLIAVEHYSKRDGPKGPVRIFSSTVIIDKTFGQFIYTIGEIGNEPRYSKGNCIKG